MSECRVLLIAGKPLREPVVWHGPFVMNTQQEIDQVMPSELCKNMFSIYQTNYIENAILKINSF